jgi:hypothetical protein
MRKVVIGPDQPFGRDEWAMNWIAAHRQAEAARA